MRTITLGAIAPGRSAVTVEAWVVDGETWQTLEHSEIHFEYRGLEEAIANHIASVSGSAEINHLRFSAGGVVLGTWVRDSGYRDV